MTLAVLPSIVPSDLPVLLLKLKETNPEYEPIFVEGEQWPINRDEYQKEYMIEVEVVQLNLNTGGMRVRYPWYSKHTKKGYEIRSVDVSIDLFYEHYEITLKSTGA